MQGLENAARGRNNLVIFSSLNPMCFVKKRNEIKMQNAFVLYARIQVDHKATARMKNDLCLPPKNKLFTGLYSTRGKGHHKKRKSSEIAIYICS